MEGTQFFHSSASGCNFFKVNFLQNICPCPFEALQPHQDTNPYPLRSNLLGNPLWLK